MSEDLQLVANLVSDNILRDDAIKRLQEENRRIKETKNLVRVTGPNGTPVYAEGDLEKDGRDIRGKWSVILRSLTNVASWELLKTMEVRFGDKARKLFPNQQGECSLLIDAELRDLRFVLELPPETMVTHMCGVVGGAPVGLPGGDGDMDEFGNLSIDDFDAWPHTPPFVVKALAFRYKDLATWNFDREAEE